MGHGDHPAANPPPLEGDDACAWGWFVTNCTGFVKDFGMMPMLVGELGLEPDARELFLLKLSMCYGSVMEKQRRESEKEVSRG